MLRRRTISTLFPYTTLFRSGFVKIMGFSLNMMTTLALSLSIGILIDDAIVVIENIVRRRSDLGEDARTAADRKSTRLNSSHSSMSYAVFCLKKKRYIQTLRN